MKLTKKQTIAIDILESNLNNITEVVYGGSAGSGKSFLGCYWIIKNCLRYPGTRWAICRKELVNLKRTTLNSFFEVCKNQGIVRDKHFIYREQAGEIVFFNGSLVYLVDVALNPSDKDFDRLGGLEITGCFVDEVAQVSYKAWNVLKSRIRYMLNEYNLIPKMFGSCNPSKTWSYHNFYKPHQKGELEPFKSFIQALPIDNPHLPKAYLESLNSLPKNERDRLFLGLWEADDDPNSLIEYDKILDIFTNNDSDTNSPKYITCDPARFGKDLAVIMVWSNLTIIELYQYDKCSITQLKDHINNIKMKYKIPNSNIIIDDDGVGGGLVDSFKGCVGFVNNSKCLNDENFQNLKTQCGYKLAELIQLGNIGCTADVSPQQREHIIGEIEQLKSEDFETDGRFKLINKDKIKLAIGRSPNYLDAMVMRVHKEIKKPYKKLFF